MRDSLKSKAGVTLLAVVLAGGWLVASVVAHDSTSIGQDWREHYSPLAKKIFYTKTQSNARFVNVGEQASDSAPLDGMDSTDSPPPRTRTAATTSRRGRSTNRSSTP